MALDTFGDQKTYVARARRDTAYEHTAEAQTEDDLNLGIQMFCDEVPLVTAYTTWEQAPDASSLGEYVPQLGVEVDEIENLATERGPLKPKTPAELAAYDVNWRTTTGNGTLFYVPNWRRDAQGRLITLVYPLPTAVLTTLAGECTRIHPVLTEDAELLLIPLAHRIAPAYWALHLGYAADKQETQDLTKAKFWEDKFWEVVRRAKKKATRRYDRSPQTVDLQR